MWTGKLLDIILERLRKRHIQVYVARMPLGYRYELESGRIVQEDPMENA